MRSIDGLKSRDKQAASQKNEKKSVVKVTTVKKNKPAQVTKKPTPMEDTPIAANDSPKVEDAKELARESFLSEPQSFDFDLTEDDIKEEKAIIKELEKQSRKTTRKEKKLEKKKDKKKVSLARKIITSVLLIIVLGMIGVVLWGFIWGNELIMKLTNGHGDIFSAIKTFTTETHVELKADENGRTNVLIFGTSGMDMEGTGFDGQQHAGSVLTDTIMVVSYDQKTQDIVMVSLPRDLKAETTCTATGKINEVFWCNNLYDDDEEGGARALVSEMKTIFGVDIQYYVHVNWGALIQIVDAVGGVDVTLDDYVYDLVVMNPGEPYHLNGHEALALARARYGTADGDFSRANHQQKILIALKDKVVSQGMDFGTAFGILNAVGDNVRTNVSLDEMKTVIFNSADMDIAKARQLTLRGDENIDPLMITTSIDGISYVLPAAGQGEYYYIQQYIKEQFKTPISEEELLKEESGEETEYLYKDY